jgi:hypothetical protein
MGWERVLTYDHEEKGKEIERDVRLLQYIPDESELPDTVSPASAQKIGSRDYDRA